MSSQSLSGFYEVVQQDSVLQRRLREAPDQESYIGLTLQLGKERGYSFAKEDVVNAIEAAESLRGESDEELSFEQLESVAGGHQQSCHFCLGIVPKTALISACGLKPTIPPPK